MKFFKYSWAVVLLFGLAFFGSGVGDHGATKRPNSLVTSSISPPKTFNMVVANETSSTGILSYLYEGLAQTNPHTLEVEPLLAESWEIKEDGRTYIFHLRKDVLWNDGTPFTAADVEFTFNDLIYNDDVSSASRSIFTVEGRQFDVTALNDYTVQVITPTPYAPLLRFIGTSILPKHALLKHVEAGTFDLALGVNSDPADVIATGPFMIERYVPGQRVILKRNPYYWQRDEEGRRLPYLDHIVIEVVQNPDVAFLKFRHGELDYLGMRGEDYALLKPQEDALNFTIYNTGPATGSQFLFFNQNTGSDGKGQPYVAPHKLKWFRNRSFRQAVSYAIDRETIIRTTMNALGSPQWAAVSPAVPAFYNPDVKKYPHNPQKAREILEAEGFKMVGGRLFDPDGNLVEFNLTTNTENTVRIRIAEIIRKDLEQLGFRVHFLPMQFNMLVARLDSTFAWDAMILGLTGGVDPHGGRNVWHSSGRTHMWFPRQEKPSTEWEARIDELFDLAVQELDPDKRRDLYFEWQAIVAEELPLIYTALPHRIEAFRNGLGGVDPSPMGVFHTVEKFYWEELGRPSRGDD